METFADGVAFGIAGTTVFVLFLILVIQMIKGKL